MAYWAAVLILGILNRMSSFWLPRRALARYADTEAHADSGPMDPRRTRGPLSQVLHAFRTYLLRLLYGCDVPKRLDLLIISGFGVLCVVICCVGYDGDIRNWHYSSDRTGVLAYACLPFLWLFSGRNNIFLWATNFDIQSFSVFHRQVAWACTILALLHSSHTKPDGSQWNSYPWTVVAISTFDRVVRIARIIYCNLHVCFSDRVISISSSRINYCEGSDLVTIEIQTASPIHAKAGQHYFLYQPITLCGWQNHPFALGAYLPASRHNYMDPSANKKVKLIFYIRPYAGWTQSIRDRCHKANETTPTLLVLEGPYGHAAPVHTFDTVLLIAGGTGIAATLPYMLEHVSRAKASPIHLIWSARQRSIFSAVFTDELRDFLYSDMLSITFFCTDPSMIPSSQPSPTPPNQAPAVTSKEIDSPAPNIHFFPGRPDIHETIQQEAKASGESNTSLAVLCSGPPQMADESRYAVYDAMRGGCTDIQYFEEAFTW
ncbi:hypothetical protein BO78DRAFT_405172 [Aspergillus sclerotiicarbonarius CBS 121057]|uniref:FAD-binding FR-type domain-containing protein n=1 Tax=Aspergillus sclerotiicarbonarius (strain CBS 121057 / IBT 28362) TaxID=1448318 RepID=A0A319EHT6_ASPSB|nr:hypothetical protein BO78DRAFT_405172 [Aspergillus sclerotiicarbonarius CBS 121057]